MKNHGLVSIITPTYNSGRVIAQTIESIQAQTYDNWELLITDDCSDDDTRAIVERYAKADPRIKLFVLEHNSGAGVARNKSIENAAGRFVAFCDSDDRWLPAKLEKQLDFMTGGGYALSHTSYLTCDESGATTGIVVCRKKETLGSMLGDDKMGFLTVMYDSSMIGGRPLMPDLRKRQDWAYKLKILEICREAHGMKEPLAVYRHTSGSLSNKKRALVKYNIAVYTDVLKWSRLRAYTYFIFRFMPKYLFKKTLQNYING